MSLLYAAAGAIITCIAVYMILTRLAIRDGGKKNSNSDAHLASYIEAAVLAVNKILPQARSASDGIRTRIATSGLPITPATYHGLSIIFFTLAFTILASWLFQSSLPLAAKGALSILSAAIILLAPRLALSYTASMRKKKIRAALPSMLDLLAICVGAGLTVPRSLRVIAQKSPALGPLADELALADQEMSLMRYSLPEALDNMAKRCQVEELSEFASVVSASRRNIAGALKSQSKHAFKRRSQELEEASNKLSTKMILPIAFLMLPATILAFAAPMVISLLSSTSGIQL